MTNISGKVCVVTLVADEVSTYAKRVISEDWYQLVAVGLQEELNRLMKNSTKFDLSKSSYLAWHERQVINDVAYIYGWVMIKVGVMDIPMDTVYVVIDPSTSMSTLECLAYLEKQVGTNITQDTGGRLYKYRFVNSELSQVYTINLFCPSGPTIAGTEFREKHSEVTSQVIRSNLKTIK